MSQEVEVKPEESSVLHYVKAAASSSDRARAVMIVMITASVLVFTAIWNTGGGWLDARIDVRTAALQYFEKGFDPNKSTDPDEVDLNNRAAQFLQEAGLDPAIPASRDLLLEDIKTLRRIRSEQVRIIHVPFFGIIFDMNDLGMFAGITFTVVLLWLTFSLARELRNLQIAFKEGEDRNKAKLCYDLLAMQQVLTVPPAPGKTRWNVWGVISKSMLVLPLLIQAEQYRTDWTSRRLGYILNPRNMKILLVTDGILFLLILFLTILCIVISVRVDRVWETNARKVYGSINREAQAGK